MDRDEFVAVMGASGARKSTLINLVGCLVRATSGTYRLDGIDVLGLDSGILAGIRNSKMADADARLCDGGRVCIQRSGRCVLFGFYPARKAARLDPIAPLHYE